MSRGDLVAGLAFLVLLCLGFYLLGRRDGIADALRRLRGRS